MNKNNYIATAFCDGTKKFFTVHNVTDIHAKRVAEKIARSLFCATVISIISLIKIN